MKKNNLSKLSDKNPPGTLFLMSDFLKDYMVDPTLKKEVLSWIHEGKIERYSYGIYFFKGAKSPTALDAIRLRYIERNGKVYGFFSGKAFLNILKGKAISPKDNKLEIVSNLATSGRKSVSMFNENFILRKPYVKIDKYNVSLVSFLTYISSAPTSEIEENLSTLSNYVRQEHLSATNLSSLISRFPAKTFSKLLKTDLYRSFWKH